MQPLVFIWIMEQAWILFSFAQMSTKGLMLSGGVMVSYLYDLDKVAGNHALYANKYRIIAGDSALALSEPEK